eukprot:6183952-Pleurochrysis_carterae.AAC.2
MPWSRATRTATGSVRASPEHVRTAPKHAYSSRRSLCFLAEAELFFLCGCRPDDHLQREAGDGALQGGGLWPRFAGDARLFPRPCESSTLIWTLDPCRTNALARDGLLHAKVVWHKQSRTRRLEDETRAGSAASFVQVLTVDTLAEAIALINANPYGTALSLPQGPARAHLPCTYPREQKGL